MRTVGLDLSIARTGMAKPDGTLISIGALHDAGTERGRRLNGIYHQIAAHLTTSRPQLAVIEQLPARGSVTTTLRLAELHGVIHHELFLQGIAIVEVNPMSLKAWAGLVIGHTVKSKDDMVSAALQAGYEPRNDDQADAALLQAVGHVAYGDRTDLPELTGTLAALPWPTSAWTTA